MSQAVAAENTIQLTDQNPTWILDPSGIKPVINTIAHPWAVLLNDSVYVKDTSSDSRRGEGLWQYSIKENTWSQHSRPELFGFKKYTPTVYHSQLTCIGGFVRSEDIEEHTENKRIFAFDGNKWKDDDVQQIPEDVNLPSYEEISASSDDTRLYLAWQKDKKVQILQYSRQRKWEKREGPDCKSSDSRIEISIFKKTIFLTEHNDKTPTVIHKASIPSYLSSSIPGSMWTTIEWPVHLHAIKPHSFFSNLTVNEGNIMLLTPFPSVPRSNCTAMLFSLDMTSASDHECWNMVGYLPIPWKPDSHPAIFGLRNKTLLIVGNTGNPLSTSTNVCVHKR